MIEVQIGDYVRIGPRLLRLYGNAWHGPLRVVDVSYRLIRVRCANGAQSWLDLADVEHAAVIFEGPSVEATLK